ncbi:MAG: IclR family transcriptional regulator [Pseudomonadota bacterium]
MAKTTMSTVDKALTLLRHFSVQRAELGLSELARLAGYDKTTTLRCMTALERNGFVEQDARSRKYRLGLAPLNLAQIREQSFPMRSVIRRHVEDLARSLGETAHGTLLMAGEPMTVAISAPARALFVHVDPSGVLPWHATASGIAIMAFLPEATRTEILEGRPLEPFTAHTPKSRAKVEALIGTCREEGLARARATYEDDVIGTAAPIFGPAGTSIGAVAVAALALRFSADLQGRIDDALRRAARTITREVGGVPPETAPSPEDTHHAAHELS